MMVSVTSEQEAGYEALLGPEAQWEIAMAARTRFLRLLSEQSAFRAIERAAREAGDEPEAAGAAEGE